MFQEYANGLNLQCLMDQRGYLCQEEARIIIRQLVKGMQYLQSMKILHRDIKLADVMLHFPTIPNLDELSHS